MKSFSSFFTTALWSATISNAAPLTPEKRGIQADQLSTFKLMSQYSASAYCASNFGSPGDQITCAAGNCPQVEAADSATAIEYSRFVSALTQPLSSTDLKD
jgi:hypothetical protein